MLVMLRARRVARQMSNWRITIISILLMIISVAVCAVGVDWMTGEYWLAGWSYDHNWIPNWVRVLRN